MNSFFFNIWIPILPWLFVSMHLLKYFRSLKYSYFLWLVLFVFSHTHFLFYIKIILQIFQIWFILYHYQSIDQWHFITINPFLSCSSIFSLTLALQLTNLSSPFIVNIQLRHFCYFLCNCKLLNVAVALSHYSILDTFNTNLIFLSM